MRPRGVLTAVILTGSLSAAFAQTTGSIEGRVSDITGTPLEGAIVEATSPNLQGTRAARSDSDGFYRILAIPPGSYRVTAARMGFQSIEKTATVRLGSTATADLVLEPSASEHIVVSANAPLIDKTSSTTSMTYTSDVIAKLPVHRNYADIVRANPGSTLDIGVTQGRYVPLAISGATSAENLWVIDGVNTTEVYQGIQGKAIHNEFVQEVEVKTSGYQPEYGRALGGVINAITKSGGNAFHGDGFVYYDSSATAAKPQVEQGDHVVPGTRTVDSSELFDYGVGLGGYVLEDRLWFYGAYNRISSSSVVQDTGYLFPVDSASNFYTGKLTWNVTPEMSVVGTVFADPSRSTGLVGFGFFNDPLNPETWQSIRLQGGTDYGAWITRLFGSRAIATLQGSYHKDDNSLTAPDGIQYTDLTCSGGTPEHRCTPQANSIYGGYGNMTSGESSRVQFAATGTMYAGSHEIKAGGDYMDGRTNINVRTTGGQRVFIYNQWGQTYYEHRFSNYTGDLTVADPFRPTRAEVIDYSVYLQDSWRAASNLTINAGLRWDGEQTQNYADETVLRFSEWQPRVGVAWDPWNDGKTRVYASAGRYSYGLPTIAALETFGSFPYLIRTFNFDRVSLVQDPNVLNHEEAQVGPGSPFGTPVDTGVNGWSQNEVTAGIERAILPTLTVGLQGTYRSLTNVLETRCDFNSEAPEMQGSACALINPGSDGPMASGNVPVCNGFIESDAYECYPRGPATPEARRYYRAIGLLARQSIGTRLWIQASYVYSSLRGNFDGGVNEGVFQQTRSQTMPSADWDFDYPSMWRQAYGKLTLDRPNHFRLDGVWTTPWLLSVGLQVFAESGSPTNKMGFFNLNYGAGVFLEPRGSLERLPTLWGTNLTLGYPFTIGPVTVTAQAYLYNVFNEQIAVETDQVWTNQMPDDYPVSIYDPNQPQNNPNYGKVTARSAPRLFRAALKVSF